MEVGSGLKAETSARSVRLGGSTAVSMSRQGARDGVTMAFGERRRVRLAALAGPEARSLGLCTGREKRTFVRFASRDAHDGRQ